MSSSDKNPGTEAFEKGQRRWAPLVLVLAAVAAVLVEGASFAILPGLLVVGALYLLIVIGGGRLITALGLKYWKGRRGR